MAVDTEVKEYREHVDGWRKIRACLDGSDAVKAGRQAYLPKPSGMDSTEYGVYVDRAVFYNATSRTLQGLTGAIFRKPIVLTDWPAKLDDGLDNVDLRGAPLNAFAKSVVSEVIGLGRVLIVADMPETGGQPYLCYYRAEDVPNWSNDYRDGQLILTRVIVRECAEKPDPNDPFAVIEVERRRVFALERNPDGQGYGFYYQELWEKVETTGKSEQWALIKVLYPLMRGQKMTEIPAQFCGPNTLRPSIEKSPIYDLVELNIAHYQTSADRRHSLHWTALPTPIVMGVPKEQKALYIGSARAWLLPTGADAKMLEHSGAGITSMRDEMADLEKQMAVTGARILEDQKADAEAALTVRLRHSGENSVLAGIAGTVERALRNALRWYAAFAGQDASNLVVTLNKDFFGEAIDGNTLTALVGAWQSGGLGLEALHFNLQRGEMLPDNMGLEEYRADIEQNGAAALLGPPVNPAPFDAASTAASTVASQPGG